MVVTFKARNIWMEKCGCTLVTISFSRRIQIWQWTTTFKFQHDKMIPAYVSHTK
ncbi:hypothetical protein GIB67_003688, partial [Kingdonia uniflora]